VGPAHPGIRLVPAGRGQQRNPCLQVGDVSDSGAAGSTRVWTRTATPSWGRRWPALEHTQKGASLVLAIYHPDEFVYSGSLSGYPNLSAGSWPSEVNDSMNNSGGFKSEDMWGPPSDPAKMDVGPTEFVQALGRRTLAELFL